MIAAESHSFMDLLRNGWQKGRLISVGLDMQPQRLPADLKVFGGPAGVVKFHLQLIEATADYALAYKPQSAIYEAMGTDGPRALLQTIELVRQFAPGVPVILDAKRGDIGSTNERYVDAIFGQYGVDAVTISPYLGLEAAAPFLDQADKGIIVLCRTSNPGAGRYQDLLVNGRPLYQHIAQDVATAWNRNGNCGLVVGATYPAELAEVRALAPQLPILVPGVGAQGGDVNATVKAGLKPDGAGLIIHASRSLVYAFEAHPELSVQEATRQAIVELQAQIDAARS